MLAAVDYRFVVTAREISDLCAGEFKSTYIQTGKTKTGPMWGKLN